jgi:uncharacterized protein YndB with AHSA1/START domain
MTIDVTVKDRVLRPVTEVFAAIIDPARLSGFFISGASGPLKAGATIEWHFADVGITLPIDVARIEGNRAIVFDWGASGVTARVTIGLEERDDDTLVTINEAAWPLDPTGVRRALGQTKGWTDFLCSMKAFLQHGVNLRFGRTREDY